MLHTEHNVCPVYLLEPTPGMHCPLANSLVTNIFPASSLLAQVLAQFDFELSRNLVTVISAAHDLNEHGLLQTSSQPMSEQFPNSVNAWNHPVSLT